MYGKGHLNLTAMMGNYPRTEPLKTAQIKSDDFNLDFADIAVAQTGFKAVCNDLAYDVAELAIVTFLQAVAAGMPLVLLPFVMNGNFHHKSLICREDSDLEPADLQGRRVAMRSYTQTTPTWVRGILSDEYGVKIDTVKWLYKAPGHVAGYVEPGWVEQSDDPRALDDMLAAGAVDAILANGMAGKPGLRTLIPNPDQAAHEWHKRHHVVPINHMIVVRSELANERPEVVGQIYDMLIRARKSAGGSDLTEDGIMLQPAGYDAVAPALEMIMRFAREQSLIPEIYSVDKLFGSVLEAIG